MHAEQPSNTLPLHATFFRTTRGKIVEELHRLQSASAVDLARDLGLTPNAIRQQLLVLERDGLVSERSVRRGPTKPTLEFSLTSRAEQLFTQPYDRMLSAVLSEVRNQEGAQGVARIFEGIAKRTARSARERITSPTPEGKMAGLAALLRKKGVNADYNLIEGGLELHEHNCPYATVVKEHPEVCSVIHRVLDYNVG
jgi:predicted ArsR family transcriptional regulator